MKDLSAAWINAINLQEMVVRVFMRLDLEEGPYGSGPYGFWNDVYDVAIGGITYRGYGRLVSVSTTAGVGDMSIPGLQLTLSGVDADVQDTFFQEVWHQKPVTISIGLLSPDTRQLVDTPDVYFSGFLDEATQSEDAESGAALTVACEDVSVRMTDTFDNTRSDADQRERDPTDTFMKNVTVAVSKTLFWGQPTPPGYAGAPQSSYVGPNHGQMGSIWGAIANRVGQRG